MSMRRPDHHGCSQNDIQASAEIPGNQQSRDLMIHQISWQPQSEADRRRRGDEQSGPGTDLAIKPIALQVHRVVRSQVIHSKVIDDAGTSCANLVRRSLAWVCLA
jgi:hypothetical protein